MAQKRIECVKKDIRSVLIIAKHGLSLDQFRKAYKSLLGIKLPSREFGYTLDIDFLYSIPDVVRIKVESDGTYQLYGIADETTEHIQKLVSRQKLQKITRKTITNGYKCKPHIVCVPKGTITRRPFVPAKLRSEIIELIKNYPEGIGYTCLVVAYQNIYKKRLNLTWLSSDHQEQFEKLVDVLPELELKIIQDQKKIFYLNYQSNEINCRNIPRSDCAKQQTEVVKSLATTTSGSSQESERYLNASAIPEIVKSRFDQILKKLPNGVLAVHFPILYEKITKVPLDIHDLGFCSLLELAAALPEIFFCVKAPGSLKDWILLHRDYSNNVLQILANYGPKMPSVQMHSSSEESVSESSQCSTTASNVLTTSSSTSHLRKKIFCKPKATQQISPIYYKIKNSVCDIAPPSLTYSPSELPVDSENGFMPVFVSAITNPSQFWFQLQTEEASCSFNRLEEEIVSFYGKGQLDNYRFADADILIGSACVAYSSADSYWYRAVITALPDVNHAKVLFVDYGSWEKIHRSMLYYLKYKFIALPAYANEACLASIKPSNQVWSEKACKEFISFCNSVSIKAKVDSMYDAVTSVFLCDTSENGSIYINDILVDEGFAEVDLTIISYGKFSNSSSPFEKNLGNDILPTPNHSMREQKLRPKKLFNGLDLPHSSLEERRYVKNVALGDGYNMNIIVVDGKAYVSSGDLCNLFWNNQDAKVLDLRLKSQHDGLIPIISISEKDFKELFSQCKKYSVKGIKETETENHLDLYYLKDVMKILNVLGHPSLKVRETICKEIQTFDPHDRIWEEFQDLNKENLNKDYQESDWMHNRLCMYDLKTKLKGLGFKRFKLMDDLRKKKLDNVEYNKGIEKLETTKMEIMKQMEEIKSICSKYATISS